jgi:uncharacterized membrane protein
MKKAIIIGSLFSINILLKLWFSLDIELNNDELFSLYHAQMSVKNIFFHLSSGNNPPFFELFLHFWIKFSGINNPWLIRNPSVLFSSFTALIIFQIGNMIKGSKVGLAAGILFTFSQFANETGILLRAYPLLVFLLTANFLAFIHLFALNKRKSLFWIFIWIITQTLAWYTHYFSIWIIISQGLFLLTNKKQFLAFLKISFFPVLFFSPFIPILFNRFLNSSSGTWVQTAPYDAIYLALWKYGNKPYMAVLFIIAIIYTIRLFIAQKSVQGMSIFYWYFIPTFSMFILSIPSPFAIPMFTDLYLYFTSPALYLLVSFGFINFIETINQKNRIYIYLVSLFILILSFFPVKFNNKLKDIDPIAFKNLTIAVYPASNCFSYMYYFDKSKFKEVQQENIYLNISKLLQKSNVFMIDSNVFYYDIIQSNTHCKLLNFEVDRTLDTQLLNKWTVKNKFLTKNISEKKQNFQIVDLLN